MGIRTVFKNTSVLLFSQIISYVLIFFYTIYIARYLGANGYGVLSFALAFSGIFSVLVELGLSTYTVREVARDKSLAKKFIGNTLLIKIILSVLTFILIVLSVNLNGYPQNTTIVIYLISLSVILTSVSGIFYSIFQAFEEMEYQSLGQILNSIIMFFGVFLGIYLGFGVIGFSFIYLIASMTIVVYSLIICSNKFSIPKIEFDKEFWKKTIKESLPFGLTGISVMLYIYVDSVLLSILQNNEVVGWYNAAYRLVLFLIFIPNTINIAIFPLMSQYHISSPISLRKINEKYFKFMITLGIPIGVGVTLLADKIILLIFGTGYLPSIITLQILIWTIVFTFGSAASVKLLEATNKQLILTKITSICLIVNVLLNLLLIPKYSYIGASIATVVTEIIIVFSVFTVSHKFGYGIRITNIVKDLVKIIFASLLMAMIIIYLKNLNLFFITVISVITYFITLYVIKGIDNEDISIIKKILGNKRLK